MVLIVKKKGLKMPLTDKERIYWTEEIDTRIADRVQRHEASNPGLTPCVTQDSREEAEVRLGIEGYQKICVELRNTRDSVSDKEEQAQASVVETYRTKTSVLEKQQDLLKSELELLYSERDRAKDTLLKSFTEQRTVAERRLVQHYEDTLTSLIVAGMVEDSTNNRYGGREDPSDTIKQRIDTLSRTVQNERLESSESGAYRLKLQRLQVQAKNEIMLSNTITHIRGIWNFVAEFLGIYSDEFDEKFHAEVGTRRSRAVTFTVDAAEDESAIEEDA